STSERALRDAGGAAPPALRRSAAQADRRTARSAPPVDSRARARAADRCRRPWMKEVEWYPHFVTMSDLRVIPAIEQLRQREAMRALETRYGRGALVEALRAGTAALRERRAIRPTR